MEDSTKDREARLCGSTISERHGALSKVSRKVGSSKVPDTEKGRKGQKRRIPLVRRDGKRKISLTTK